MAQQQKTPPTASGVEDFLDLPCPGGSASTTSSYLTQDWSPQSVMTAGTTPPTKSPARFRDTGPQLLPKVRAQDQFVDYVQTAPHQVSHARTHSLPANGYPVQFGGQLPIIRDIDRRSASPANTFRYAVSTYSSPYHPPAVIDAVQSKRPPMVHARSASHVPTHSRNSSSGSIDVSMLNRYGYPTYRQSPTPQPTGVPCSATAMSHLAPISMPSGYMQSYPQPAPRRRTASPPAAPKPSTEPEYDPELDLKWSTLLSYLTAPNPAPSPIQRAAGMERPGQKSHFWFDVRNVRGWSDFNVKTIVEMPRLLDLLQVGVALRALPEPGRVNLNPETRAHLTDLCAAHHLVKVNAANMVAQGKTHIAIRSLAAGARSQTQPEFVSNYQSDAERTIYGDGRGRVVGIVRGFEEWNSGMLSEGPSEKVIYLRALAILQKHMRDHGCRYGFIMTEIELVCVRAGGPPDQSGLPLFGFLELAAPVRMATNGLAQDGSIQMTAGLALWYLHLLAKEQPLPGQYSWRLDVGGPAACTRQHHLEKDDWIPKPNLSEKREAKRIRGWVYPDEPYNKKEGGGSKRPPRR